MDYRPSDVTILPSARRAGASAAEAAKVFVLAWASTLASGCATSQPTDVGPAFTPLGAPERREIEALLAGQVQAWNRGDFDGFMDGYWRSDELTFVSGGEITRGWSATLEGYRRRYVDREAMGRLDFEVIEMRRLGPRAAMVLGRWRVERQRPIGGLFTLMLRRIDGRWRVVYDHTSVGSPPT